MKIENHPPKWANRLFQFFCHEDFYEELQGDLEEVYYENVNQKGWRYANRIYCKEVLLMLRPSVIKKFNPYSYLKFSPDMIKNYLKIAFRSFYKHKLFSFINTFGLAIGMCVGLFVIAMINDLLQYDQFHSKKEQIYRLISRVETPNRQAQEMATTTMPLAQNLKEDFSGIEEVVRIHRYFGGLGKVEDKSLTIKGHLVDNNFFSVFSFPLISGNPQEVLKAPFSAVITEETALRFFGKKDPIGEEIQVGEYGLFRITGLMKNVPVNSHLQFEILASFSTIASLEKEGKISKSLENWSDLHSNYAYLLINQHQDVDAIQLAINEEAKATYSRFDDLKTSFELQALTSIIPGRDLSNQIGPKMPYLPLVIFSVIALMVLLSSCFNYTNLSIARSLGRAKEIGIRKTVGASQNQIFTQFLIEACLISFFALGLGLFVFEALKPGFYTIIPRSEQFSLELSPQLLLLFLLFALGSGFLAGFFPAVVLSRMKPALILKKLVSHKLFKKLTARKALIVFQFTLSMLFIISTMIVWKQYKFALYHDLGFAQENRLNVELQGADYQKISNAFKQIPAVQSIAFTSLVPGTGSTSSMWLKKVGSLDSTGTYFMDIDKNYIPQNDFELIAGRNFPEKNSEGNSEFVIINEQLLQWFDWDKEMAIGQWIIVEDQLAQIVGVMKNFHYTHLEEPIKKFLFRYQPEQSRYASILLSSNDLPQSMQKLEQTWHDMGMEQEFKAKFVDEELGEVYAFFGDIMRLFGFVAMLCITIACLGLLGIAVYTIETRIKEISIRKIFGASSGQLVLTLSKGFIYLIGVAALIAIPTSYLLFDQIVLNNFAYRINIGWLELGSGLFFVLMLSLLTIGSQTLKAVRTSPAQNLRME